MFGCPSEPGQPGFAQEPLRGLGVGVAGQRELLQGHLALEVGLAREIDGRHPAAADDPEDLVVPDPPAHAWRLAVRPAAGNTPRRSPDRRR